MPKLTYLKLFLDYLDAVEPLGVAERGRLFTALLEYARTGAAPQLSGNERFLFPMMRAQIDRDQAELEELSIARSEAGKQGGRPGKQKKQMLSEKAKKANGFSESKKSKDKEKDKDKDNDEDKDEEERVGRTAPARRPFSPPEVEEIAAYCAERGNGVNPQQFFDFYESKGWMVGKNRMKDWKAAVRTWERREPEKPDRDNWKGGLPDL